MLYQQLLHPVKEIAIYWIRVVIKARRIWRFAGQKAPMATTTWTQTGRRCQRADFGYLWLVRFQFPVRRVDVNQHFNWSWIAGIDATECGKNGEPSIVSWNNYANANGIRHRLLLGGSNQSPQCFDLPDQNLMQRRTPSLNLS